MGKSEQKPPVLIFPSQFQELSANVTGAGPAAGAAGAGPMVELFSAPKCRMLLVSPVLPKAPDFMERVTLFTPHAFARTNNFQWSDTVTVPKFIAERLQHEQGEVKTKKLSLFLQGEIEPSIEQLVICNMGETGKGVFLHPDANHAIPAGTVVAVYAGAWQDANDISAEAYAYAVDAPLHDIFAMGEQFRSELIAFLRQQKPESDLLRDLSIGAKFGHASSVNAFAVGNIARFFQFLPSRLALRLQGIANLDEIQSANLVLQTGYLGTIPILYLETLIDVKPGDPLGWDYGSNAKQKISSFRYFNRYGEQIQATRHPITMPAEQKMLGDLQKLFQLVCTLKADTAESYPESLIFLVLELEKLAFIRNPEEFEKRYKTVMGVFKGLREQEMIRSSPDSGQRH